MDLEGINVKNIHDARDKILDSVRRNKDKHVFCFSGWGGFGAASVLRSIAQAVPSMKDPPPELRFGRTIYLDCSRWKSKRVMQRRIAEELKLDSKIMVVFDKQDKEDDYRGVDLASRDVIRSVAAEIDRTLQKSKYIIIFLNGSDEEVPLSTFGIPQYRDGVVIWASTERFPKMHCDLNMLSKKLSYRDLRYTDIIFFCGWSYRNFTSSQFSAVFQEEAARVVARYPCIRGINRELVTDCCLYGLFLNQSFETTTTGFCWAPHASNYWTCDGIIQGDSAREIGTALHTEISFECDVYVVNEVLNKKIKLHPKTPYLALKHDDFADFYEKRPYRWVSITPSGGSSNEDSMYNLAPPMISSKNKITWENKKAKEDMQTILAGATTIFIAFERTDSPQRLPNALFEPCRNLAVLILYCSAFSFVSPPFLHCHTLRFLGLDHCTDDDTTEFEGEEGRSKWAFLNNLWVLDLRYTNWVEILSKEKLNLMSNLTELNIEGFRCWQYTTQLQERLPYLQRLRITKPTMCHHEEISSMDSTSFIDRSKLQVVDLSGNSDMKILPTSLSKASNLDVLVVDGCNGLQNVMLLNMLLLRTFSFDGYGPTSSNWTSATELPPESSRPKSPPDADRKDVKTSTISLEGCKKLESLFLRGLPNLVELDLSGCAIKILDLTKMVVDVPRLKRLFLLGCENLCAIMFGSQQLELLCIDTRPDGRVLGRPAIAQHKSFKLQMYAATTDARLTWSLWPLLRSMVHHRSGDDAYLDISISSSTGVHGGIVQVEEETGNNEVTCKSFGHEERHQMYDDVFVKIAEAPTPMQAFPHPPAQKLDRHVEMWRVC